VNCEQHTFTRQGISMGERRATTYHIRRLSRALATLRRESRLMQEEVADKVGVSFQVVSRIEIGQLPTIPTLRALLDVYGVLTSDYKQYEDIWHLANAPYWWKGLVVLC
jgi:transcriptional regulator with XRE-family HTH domain